MLSSNALFKANYTKYTRNLGLEQNFASSSAATKVPNEFNFLYRKLPLKNVESCGNISEDKSLRGKCFEIHYQC